jgi:hypothetical protein
MRRLSVFVIAVVTAALLVPAVLAPFAGAQAIGTSDVAKFCASRLELDKAQRKSDALGVFNDLVASAPAAVVAPVTEVRDAFKKQGFRAFDKVGEQITVADTWVYENCPGNAVAVTAADYSFAGMPATLPAGLTKLKLVNSAPKEFHEIGIAPLTDAGVAMDVEKLLATPERKQAKLLDFSRTTGAYAEPGGVGFTITDLQPGKYVYVCYVPVGGKTSGAPHYTEGMYGTFTVS